MVDYNSTPFIVDWNEDGKKDLLTGQTGEYGGTNNVRVYLNVGEDSAPVFNTYTPITCAGAPINLQRASPVVYDLDRDGIKDLIVGDKLGYVYFYKNEGTNANPVFNSNQRLTMQGGAYITDGLANPHIHFNDWDEDGDLDLIFGEYGSYNGYIRVYLNLTNPGVEETYNAITAHPNLSVAPTIITNQTSIQYTLAKPDWVKVNVYSANGQLVASPIDQYQTSGVKQFTLNLNSVLTPGVYFIQLQVGKTSEVTRITLLK